MIKEVHIQNFLSHKKTMLEFSPGLNIIVGESDTGKSAIVRALRWLILNRPTGETFRSNWGGKTLVRVSFDDVEIVRYKNEKENAYGIVTEDNVDLFKAIRTDVPDEVSKALRLGVDNVQTQFESHFLLSRSPGDIAHHFNSIAHLDNIDVGTSNIKKWIGVASAFIIAEEGSIEDEEEKLSNYSNIDIIEDKMRCLEEVESSLIFAERSEDFLNNVIGELDLLNVQISQHNSIISAESKVDKIIGYIEAINELEDDVLDLQNSIDSLVSCSKAIRKEQDVLESEKDVNSLLVIYDEIKQLGYKEEELSDTIAYIESTLKAIEQEQLALNVYEDEWHNNVGEVCPLCGNEIK